MKPNQPRVEGKKCPPACFIFVFLLLRIVFAIQLHYLGPEAGMLVVSTKNDKKTKVFLTFSFKLKGLEHKQSVVLFLKGFLLF